MIRTLIYLAIVLAGLCLSPYLIGNTGYVYLAAGDYEVETSLVFAVTALIIGFLVVTWLVKAIKWLLRLVFTSGLLPENWRRKAAKRHTLKGALAIAEEDWPDAERFMAKGASRGELPALNLLAAARAAQHQGKYVERDSFLERAAKEPSAELAAKTSKARYLLQQGALERSRLELDKLNPSSKSKLPVIRLALEVYQAQQDWPALRELLPAIGKHRLLTDLELDALKRQVNLKMIERAAKQGSDALDKEWQWLSRAEKQQSDNLAAYAVGLAQHGQRDEAIKLLLKETQTECAQPVLSALALLATAADAEVRQQLAKLESRYQEHHEYHECMAVLSLQARDFKAAKAYQEKACELEPCKQNWLALGKQHEQLGESALALSCYRKAAMA